MREIGKIFLTRGLVGVHRKRKAQVLKSRDKELFFYGMSGKTDLEMIEGGHSPGPRQRDSWQKEVDRNVVRGGV